MFHNLSYASQIQQLEKEIVASFSTWCITVVKSFHICPVGVRDEHKMHETIFKHVSKVTNDLHYNAMILQQMSAGDMFGGAIDEALCNYNGLVKSDLYCDWRKIFGI